MLISILVVVDFCKLELCKVLNFYGYFYHALYHSNLLETGSV